MPGPLIFDRIQIVSILFSLVIFCIVFSLVKNKRIREEYSILWFVMSLFLLYLSLDRYAIDRIGYLFGVAYPPSILTLMTTGFTFLLLLHLSMVVSSLSGQNKDIIQTLGLWQTKPIEKQAGVLAIVPAYNEEQSIDKVVADLSALPFDLDILVINDGSEDRTSSIARNSGQALVIDLPKNLGIGGAVQTGFKYAAVNGYQTAIQFDADGQHLAGEIPKLLQKMQDKGVSMVIGSRFLDGLSDFRSPVMRRIGMRLFQAVNSLLIGQQITDNTSGFRAYDRRAIEFLARHYPVDYPEPEAVILLGRNGFTIAEVQVCMAERQGGESSISGFKGGYYMVKVLLAILMTALRRPVHGSQP